MLLTSVIPEPATHSMIRKMDQKRAVPRACFADTCSDRARTEHDNGISDTLFSQVGEPSARARAHLGVHVVIVHGFLEHRHCVVMHD